MVELSRKRKGPLPGSVIQSPVSALRAKIAPNEAEPDGFGGPKFRGENEVRHDFRRNPMGRG
jgi:hypothetical protein